jgi:hypothetical protein
VNKETLEEALKKCLHSEIERKVPHGKLYKARWDELVNLLDSSTWLKHENNSPRGESPLLQPTGQEYIQRGGTAMPTLQNCEENCRPSHNKVRQDIGTTKWLGAYTCWW